MEKRLFILAFLIASLGTAANAQYAEIYAYSEPGYSDEVIEPLSGLGHYVAFFLETASATLTALPESGGASIRQTNSPTYYYEITSHYPDQPLNETSSSGPIYIDHYPSATEYFELELRAWGQNGGQGYVAAYISPYL